MSISAAWQKGIQGSADPDRARRFYNQFSADPAADSIVDASAEQARLLATLFAGSQALPEHLLTHPEWIHLALDLDGLRHPRRVQGLRREVQSALHGFLDASSHAEALSWVRQFKQREMLRIALRDLGGLGALPDLLRELSDLADVCVEAVLSVVSVQFDSRFGTPHHLTPDGQWLPTAFCILGMGKLGGQELNYSSDIDLLFVYSEEGFVFNETPQPGTPGKGLSNHLFYQRLIETLVAELTRLSPEGALYRVDLRLRPEGDAGPLARSVASYENYYAQWGQTWERMMLIKTRCVAGDPVLAGEFQEMIQSFRYPRFLPERVLAEIAGIKYRIETEIVRSGELDRNVKLGRGGIREVEFVVQSLQLLNGGRMPFLQNPQTLPTLDKMVQYGLLDAPAAHELGEAYIFLRRVEHRLQMEGNLQTHSIPGEQTARLRLARLMDFADLDAFEAARQQHTQAVRRRYETLVNVPSRQADLPLPLDFEDGAAGWKQLLANHSFTRIEHSFGVLRTFVEGPGYVHISPRTVELARQLICLFLRRCPQRLSDGRVHWPDPALSDPDRVLVRLDSYVTAYGSRAMLFESWTSKPSVFELLLILFDRSEFLAETAIRTPDLVEDLMLSGQLRRRKSPAQILEELRRGCQDQDQLTWIRRYHQAEFMRLGLRDILGLVDFELSLQELSGLAEACLQYALESVMRRHRRTTPPFAIIGLGKLGGAELTYGSDLDIIFVADSRTRNLHPLQQLAQQVMELLSSPTEYGVAFPTDARLRPDGQKGLLVNTLQAYEDYYLRRAMLWEIQAISRARTVAGSQKIGRRFEDLAASLSNFQEPVSGLSCYRHDWRHEIARMRRRIEKERTPAGQDPLAIKTGRGGIIDAEFIAQAHCLAQGWHEPNTLRALERIRQASLLDPQDADQLIEHYRRLLRIEGILRRWSFVGEATLPEEPAPLYRVSVRCGYHDPTQFLQAVTEHRNVLRQVYDKTFPTVS